MEEDIGSWIERACELSRNLEWSYRNNQADDVVLRLIDDIVETLNGARERVASSSLSGGVALEQEMIITGGSSSGTRNYVQPVTHQLIQMQQQQQIQAPRNTNTTTSRGALLIGEMASERSADMEASPSSRRRKRKDHDVEKRTMMVPAPQYGNTEMPPEDGYTWRKYGQKEILGSNYPRSYYRCTHQKLYECPAKKQVQRLDNNPNIFAVTYRGEHTCHMSSTAPSSSVPPQLLPSDISHHHHDTTLSNTTTPTAHLSPSSATAVSRWLSSVPIAILSGAGSSHDVDPSAAGPSTTRFGGAVADYPVADMADAMFNSGSSSGNSMESLFLPPTDKKSGSL